MHSKLKVFWIDGVGCNGCTHSFLNYSYFENILERFEFVYHPILPSAEFNISKSDILIIEGALRENFLRLGRELRDLLEELIKESEKVIALGSCSSYGGVWGEGMMFFKEKKGRFYRYKNKIINIPGCPPHPEWLVGVLNMLYEKKEICLDELNRPKDIFAFTSHMGCSRNEYFEWKIDAQEFGEKEGCLFYEKGCQGPFTHSNCNVILWNEVSSKPRVGTPCFGCTEPTFPKENLFSTETFMGIPANIPVGVSKRAYFTLAGVAKSLHNERLSSKLINGCEDENNTKNNK